MFPKIAPRLIFTFALLAVAAVFAIGIVQLPTVLSFQQISAKVWPTTLVIALAAVGIVYFLTSGEQPAAEAKSHAEDDEENYEDETPAGPQAWLFVGALIVSGGLIPHLGYWVTASLLMAIVILMQAGAGKITRGLVICLLLPGALYFMFTQVLSQYLPIGSLLEYLIN